MIEEALVYTAGVVLIAVVAIQAWKHVSEIENEAKIAKATAYANAQKAGYLAEAGALNYGQESEAGGLGDIGNIVSLLSNPAAQELIKKFVKKE